MTPVEGIPGFERSSVRVESLEAEDQCLCLCIFLLSLPRVVHYTTSESTTPGLSRASGVKWVLLLCAFQAERGWFQVGKR